MSTELQPSIIGTTQPNVPFEQYPMLSELVGLHQEFEKLSPTELEAMNRICHRVFDTPPRVHINEEGGITFYGDTDNEQSISRLKLMVAFGTGNSDVALSLLQQFTHTLYPNEEALGEKEYNRALAIMYRLQPKDETEAMLHMQMVAIHELSMYCIGRGGEEGSIRYVETMMNQANKLSRTYVAQMEALQRYRGKRDQQMTVEQVHVNEGGQAIIGNVEQTRY